MKWYQTRVAKLRFFALGLVGLVIVGLIYLGVQFKQMIFGTDLPKETEVVNNDRNVTEKVLDRNLPGTAADSAALRRSMSFDAGFPSQLCYKWKICNGTLCKTDVGVYTVVPGDTDTVRLCADRRCVEPCKDDNVLSSGR